MKCRYYFFAEKEMFAYDRITKKIKRVLFNKHHNMNYNKGNTLLQIGDDLYCVGSETIDGEYGRLFFVEFSFPSLIT